MLDTNAGPNQEATARTFRSRARWFLTFLDEHHISDLSLSSLTLEQRNHLFAMYAASLLRRDNIKALTICTGTVDRYLFAAASQVREATVKLGKVYFDPRHDKHGRPSSGLAKVKWSHQRWERMPCRREPVTVPMLLYMQKQTVSSDPHNLVAVHFDWQVLGHHFGFRKSEWCQDSVHMRDGNFRRAPSGDHMASIFSDFTLLGKNDYEHTDTTEALQRPDVVHSVRYCWRYQKNGDNGATRTVLRNTSCPDLCPVRAAMRILSRARALAVKPDDPVAVFVSSDDKAYSFITNEHVQVLVRSAASAVYNINDHNRLRLWSCHSIRVGACVQLYNSKHSPDKIQHLLRWKSVTWRDYLRDCSSLSASQLDGISAAAKAARENEMIQHCD